MGGSRDGRGDEGRRRVRRQPSASREENGEKDGRRYRRDRYDDREESGTARHHLRRGQSSSRDRGARDAASRSPRERPSHHHRDRQRSTYRSQRPHARDDDRDRSRSPIRKSRKPLPSQNDSYQAEVGVPATGQAQKQKPNFKPTGLLAKEANTVAGTTTVLKYHEPPEARKPPNSQQWRMYVFKEKDLLDTVYLFQRSCWLLGRDQKVTDLFLEHSSISKQHAVIQFRHSVETNEFGDKTNRVKPYVIDLESANGTQLNGNRISESRYVELVDGDVISFGHSEREYVMMLPAPEKK